MQKITGFLQQLGLDDKEIKVYFSLLKLGLSTANEISRDSGITRTYIYDITEDLKNKGFLSIIEEENGIRAYQAINETGLMALAAQKKEEMKILQKKISEASSDFEIIKKYSKQKTKVQFFQGKSGILNIYEEIKNDLKKTTEQTEIITIFSPERLEKTFPGWFDNKKYIKTSKFVTKRDILHESKIFNKHLKQRNKDTDKYSYKIWSKEKEEFPADTLCWGNKIAFIELSDYPSGVIMENTAVVKTFQMWFEQMWDNL